MTAIVMKLNENLIESTIFTHNWKEQQPKEAKAKANHWHGLVSLQHASA